MALVFIDGFDHYDPQASGPLGEPWLARGKAAYLSPQATRIAGRRPSSYALRLPAGPGGGYVKNLEAAASGLTVGAALRTVPYANTGAVPVLLGVRDVDAQVAYFVRIGDDGRLRLLRGQHGFEQLVAISVASAPARGWHYVELQVLQGRGDGVLSVRINGMPAIHLAGLDTLQDGGELVTAFVGASPGQDCPVTLDVDDLYVADTTGTINNTFLGDVRVDALVAQADGSLNEWSVTPAGTAAWQAVSDDDEASAIQAAAGGLRQTFRVAPLPVMASPAIHGVQLALLARKTDAGLGSLKGLVASDAQAATGPDVALQEQLAWHTVLFERDPGSGDAWTEAGFNAAEFGVESSGVESP